MLRRSAVRFAALVCFSLILTPVIAPGHPGDPAHFYDTELGQSQEHDQESVYEGPGWLAGQGGGPSVVFPANGVELLSWITALDFGETNTSASTVEGYVSPSGREYAVVGLRCGTGFVEVTDPRNAAIRAFITGPCSLWRDIRLYSTYAYSVSEGGSGVQVIDISQIDEGIATLVNTITAPAPHQSSTHTLEINQASGYLYRCGGGSVLGVKIYTLADPANPTHVSTIFTNRYVHECQVVNYTDGPYAGKEIAFFYNETSSGGGSASLGIVDVTVKTSPLVLSNYQYPNSRFSHQGWLSEDRRYVYLDDELDETGLGIPMSTHVIDVQDLTAPVQVATFTDGTPCIDHNQYVKNQRLFQSNYRCGLRIWDLTNPTAPMQTAYFDTYPDNNGANFNSLWDNYPYLPSGIILGSSIEQGLFVWCADPRGDMNHDGRITLEDLPLFVEALLTDTPDIRCGGPDLTADEVVNGADIPGFMNALLGS